MIEIADPIAMLTLVAACSIHASTVESTLLQSSGDRHKIEGSLPSFLKIFSRM
jgi:hypothetical protein